MTTVGPHEADLVASAFEVCDGDGFALLAALAEKGLEPHHLKDTNDTCGHAVGDMLLHEMGTILTKWARRAKEAGRNRVMG